MKRLSALAAAPVALVVLLAAGFAAQDDSAQACEGSALTAGVNVAAVRALARQMLPFLQQRLDADCPDLPALWVVAETEAESGWDPNAFSPAGAAGLLQFMPDSWVSAGGHGGPWSTSAAPPASHPVWDPASHLAVAVPFMCANLRLVTARLHATGKPTSLLDALAVCHIDDVNAGLVLEALAHRCGWHECGSIKSVTGTFAGSPGSVSTWLDVHA